MNRQEAFILVANLATASANHVKVVNGMKRGKSKNAAEAELKTARKLLKALLPTEDFTDDEIASHMGW
jgi:hypothetical protein